MSGLCQVIIKNTNAFKETPSSITINRSQSLLTTNRTPVLAPSRVERCRLEALLSDVWSRQFLPYPGMTHRARSEHIVRTSASSMMRKLSVASIASNFTKQSSSAIFAQRTAEIDELSKFSNPNPPSPHNDDNINSSKSDLETPSKPGLLKIPDEKENVSHKNSQESLAVMAFGLGNGSTGLKSTEKLKSKNSYASNSLRITTPLIRSSSTNNNNNLHKLLSLPISTPLSSSMAKDIKHSDLHYSIAQAKEPQPSWKVRKNEKVNRKGSSVVVEGIRNFFR